MKLFCHFVRTITIISFFTLLACGGGGSGGGSPSSPTATATPSNNSFINGTASIILSFSESMDPASLVLTGSLSGESNGGTWSTTISNNDTLTISPLSSWSQNTHTVTVNIDSAKGIALTTLTLNYTIDTTLPTGSINPGSGASISDSEPIVITFAESMDINSHGFAGSLAGDVGAVTWSTTVNTNDTLTINPVSNWTTGSQTLDIAASDIAGNTVTLSLVYTIGTDADGDGFISGIDCNDNDPAVYPGATEVCNGIDDNCDLTIDESFICTSGTAGTCTTSCGTAGARICDNLCNWGSCSPPAETCNGVDDDCDGFADNGFACASGTSELCTTMCGTTGTRTCSSSCNWGTCTPPAEVCNGIDDDCDGLADNGFMCSAGSTGACTTSCGTTGTRSCDSTCGWGACSPPVEICNGVDDDCDGAADNGFACAAGSTGACTTSCGSTGTRSCDASCGWGSCSPPVEICNGVDDNCDGIIDENCSIPITGTGGRYDLVLTENLQSGSCGGTTGAEASISFSLANTSDVFITTHNSIGQDTVIYLRNSSNVELGCNDDADGYTTSVLSSTFLPAGDYLVYIDSKSLTSANISVDINISAPGQASDRCGNPSSIPAGATSLTGNTCGFTSDYAPVQTADCSTLSTGQDAERVYYFVVPAATAVSVNPDCAIPSYDQTLYMRSICNDAAATAQVACGDDGGCPGPLTCSTGALTSSVTVTLVPGLYYAFVDGYPGTCGCGDFNYILSGF